MSEVHPHDIANLPHYLAVMTAKGVPHEWVKEQAGWCRFFECPECVCETLTLFASDATARDLNALLGACVVRLLEYDDYALLTKHNDGYAVCDTDIGGLIVAESGIGPTPLAACIAALEQLP